MPYGRLLLLAKARKPLGTIAERSACCFAGPFPMARPRLELGCGRRLITDPAVRVDRNDYSLDPALAGRRVEVRVSQEHVTN
jgi:hypothetical protein